MYPENFVTLDELKDDYPSLSVADWKKLAEGINIPLVRVRVLKRGDRIKKTVLGLYVENIREIESAYEPPRATEEIISANKLALELNTGQKALRRAASECGVFGFVYNFGKGPNGTGFNSEQADLIRSIFELRKTKMNIEGVRSLASLRRLLGVGVTTLDEILESIGVVPREYFFGRAYGKGINAQEFELLENYLRRSEVKVAPENVTSVNKIAVEIGTSSKTLLAVARGVGIEPGKYRFRGHEGYGLTVQELEQITVAYSEFNRDDKKPVSAKSYSRENRIPPDALTAIAESIGIQAKIYRFGKKDGFGYTPEEIERMKSAYSGFEQHEFADDTVTSVARLAKREHMASGTMKKLFDEAGIEVSTFRFGNGKLGAGVRQPQIDALQRVYAPFIQSPSAI